VTSLEPRTPHQPEKLRTCQRTILFYSFSFFRQSKLSNSISLSINRLQPVHRPLTDFGATLGSAPPQLHAKPSFYRNCANPSGAQRFASAFTLLCISRGEPRQSSGLYYGEKKGRQISGGLGCKSD
jgi:hypothetical protein